MLKQIDKKIFTFLHFFLSKPVYITSNLSSHGKQGNVNVLTVLPAKSDSYVMLCLQSYIR